MPIWAFSIGNLVARSWKGRIPLLEWLNLNRIDLFPARVRIRELPDIYGLGCPHSAPLESWLLTELTSPSLNLDSDGAFDVRVGLVIQQLEVVELITVDAVRLAQDAQLRKREGGPGDLRLHLLKVI